MRTDKLYRIVKGGGGANLNAISITSAQTPESMAFLGRVRQKAIAMFGQGASLNTIGTTYGVQFRYEDEKKNRKMARMLIKIVELETELLRLKAVLP
jgi:hypothetical protein